jgi:SnoaL-like domain
MPAKNRSLEERLRDVEDRLEILNLIAGHPPGADTGDGEYAASFCDENVVLEFSEHAPKWSGRAQVAANLQTAAHKGAIEQGVAHFAGLPYIEIDGDRATVTSYLQILTPNPASEPFELSGHGKTQGYRVHRLSANRWELVRTPDGWRIKSRTGRAVDTPAARQLLRETTRERLAKLS